MTTASVEDIDARAALRRAAVEVSIRAAEPPGMPPRETVGANASRIWQRHHAKTGEAQAVFGARAWPRAADPARRLRKLCAGKHWPTVATLTGFARAAGVDWRELYAE